MATASLSTPPQPPVVNAIRTTTAATSSGPIAMILDFTSLSREAISAAVGQLVGCSTLVNDSTTIIDTNATINLSRDINSALAVFGIIFGVSQSGGLCPDDCVPTSVMGLFRKGEETASPTTTETVWLYNSTDKETLVVADSEEGNEHDDGTAQRRARRLWTSNRHYADGILPVIVGCLYNYCCIASNSGVGSKRGRANIPTISSPSSANNTALAALTKALAFNNRHKGVFSSTSASTTNSGGRKKNGGSNEGGAASSSAAFVSPTILYTCLQPHHSSQQGQASRSSTTIGFSSAAVTPSTTEMATSMLAIQLLATRTQLYVGVGGRTAVTSDNNNKVATTNWQQLAAIAAASGGAAGALTFTDAEADEAEHDDDGSVPIPPLPTIADHILGFVDDAFDAVSREQEELRIATVGGGNNKQQQHHITPRHLHETSSSSTSRNHHSISAADIASRVATYAIHNNTTTTITSSSTAATKADACGVSIVVNDTLCIRKV